jgi:hypothetical protein
MNAIYICYCRSPVFQLCNLFQEILSPVLLDIMLLWEMLRRDEHTPTIVPAQFDTSFE